MGDLGIDDGSNEGVNLGLASIGDLYGSEGVRGFDNSGDLDLIKLGTSGLGPMEPSCRVLLNVDVGELSTALSAIVV
jgi:hypothetical protein